MKPGFPLLPTSHGCECLGGTVLGSLTSGNPIFERVFFLRCRTRLMRLYYVVGLVLCFVDNRQSLCELALEIHRFVGDLKDGLSERIRYTGT